MHFLSDAIAEIEGLLEVNRDFCKKQMAENASPALPTNCAVVPLMLQRVSPLRRRGGGFPLAPSNPSGCTPMLLGFYRKFYGSFTYRFPNQHNKPVTWECATKGSRWQSQTSSVPIAPLSRPQTRNLRAADKFYFIKAPPHNSAARLAMPFPPSAACKFLDLPPVNLRNLHLHLTKNPFASRPPHLYGVTLKYSASGNISRFSFVG